MKSCSAKGPYLKAPHPAARFRDIEAVKREEAAERSAAAAAAPVKTAAAG